MALDTITAGHTDSLLVKVAECSSTELSRIWSLHYMPYKMARVKYIFGWPYYLHDVKRDIEIAGNL